MEHTSHRANSVYSRRSQESDEDEFYDAEEELSLSDNSNSSQEQPVSPVGFEDIAHLSEDYEVSPLDQEHSKPWSPDQANPEPTLASSGIRSVHRLADSDITSSSALPMADDPAFHPRSAAAPSTTTSPHCPVYNPSQYFAPGGTDFEALHPVNSYTPQLMGTGPTGSYGNGTHGTRGPISNVEEEGVSCNQTPSGAYSRWTNLWYGARASALKASILSQGSSVCQSIASGCNTVLAKSSKATGFKWLDRRSSKPRLLWSERPVTKQSGQGNWKSKIWSRFSSAVEPVQALVGRWKESGGDEDTSLPTRRNSDGSILDPLAYGPVC